MSLRKVASVLVGLGLVIGLMGAGIGASFTDSASATANISVGTFGLQITSTTSGATVTNTGTPGNSVHTVVYTCPTIVSSATGSCPLQLTLTNTGTIPMTVAVAWNTVATPFQAVPLLSSYSIAGGAHQDLNAGIFWASELTNANLGQSVSVTYTFTATQ